MYSLIKKYMLKLLFKMSPLYRATKRIEDNTNRLINGHEKLKIKIEQNYSVFAKQIESIQKSDNQLEKLLSEIIDSVSDNGGRIDKLSSCFYDELTKFENKVTIIKDGLSSNEKLIDKLSSELQGVIKKIDKNYFNYENRLLGEEKRKKELYSEMKSTLARMNKKICKVEDWLAKKDAGIESANDNLLKIIKLENINNCKLDNIEKGLDKNNVVVKNPIKKLESVKKLIGVDIAGGISKAKYYKKNQTIVIRGWFLPQENYSEITLLDKNQNEIQNIKYIKEYREDVAKRFTHISSDKAGFVIIAPNINLKNKNNIFLIVKQNNKILRTIKVDEIENVNESYDYDDAELKDEKPEIKAFRQIVTANDTWLKDNYNAYKGERCFLIGTGPSINAVDLSKLNNEIVMGVNGIYLKDELELDFYCSVSFVFYKHHKKEMEKIKCGRCFYPSYLKELDPESPTSWFNDIEYGSYSKYTELTPLDFSLQVDKYIYVGGTVISVCLQILYYLGFKEIILLGIDHNYNMEPTQIPGEGIWVEGSNLSAHFTDNYYKKKGKIHVDIHGSERAYKLCKYYYEKDGRKIYNATEGTKLDIFEKKKLEEIL